MLRFGNICCLYQLFATLIISVNLIEITHRKSSSLKINLPVAPRRWKVVTGQIAATTNFREAPERKLEGVLSFN
jgi:hypothetical protein